MLIFNKKVVLAIAGVAAFVPFTAHAANQTGNASATIGTAIAVSEDTQMDFATIVTDNSAQTVTLTSAGSISAGGGSYTFLGSPAAAAFSATGEASQAVTISFSTGDTLTDQLAQGGAAMALGNFTNDAGGTPAFDGSGNLSFNVGADLTVGANQVASSYAGTYTITVDYQ